MGPPHPNMHPMGQGMNMMGPNPNMPYGPNSQGMMGPSQGMMGPSQGMMGPNQQGMMPPNQGMMMQGQPPMLMGNQNMMAGQMGGQGMMPPHSGMPPNSGMMPQQPGMMPGNKPNFPLQNSVTSESYRSDSIPVDKFYPTSSAPGIVPMSQPPPMTGSGSYPYNGNGPASSQDGKPAFSAPTSTYQGQDSMVTNSTQPPQQNR